MPDPAGLKPARLFLALWPSEPVRDMLVEEGLRLHKALSGRLTRAETVHLTLVFVGDLARDRIPGLIERLDALALPAFRIDFDRADCWRHNRIAFLTASRPPDLLYGLVAQIEQGLADLRIPFDRRPYKPHVTLLRNARCPNRNPAAGRVPDSPGWGDVEPITWSAEGFVLVESVSIPEGVRYDVLRSFRLL
jgi:2'-5' RNA ligase